MPTLLTCWSWKTSFPAIRPARAAARGFVPMRPSDVIPLEDRLLLSSGTSLSDIPGWFSPAASSPPPAVINAPNPGSGAGRSGLSISVVPSVPEGVEHGGPLANGVAPPRGVTGPVPRNDGTADATGNVTVPITGSGGGAPSSPVPGPAPGDLDNDRISIAVGHVDGQRLVVIADQMRNCILVKYGTADPTDVYDHFDGLNAPGAVALADLNGDGQADLIVANSGSNNVLIFPGLGGGQFGPEINGGQGFSVGANPIGITVADINLDGVPDLVIANKDSQDVSILLGRGQGDSWTLTRGPLVHCGLGPVATVVKDVTGDGIPDLLVSNSEANTVSLIRGRRGGTFDDAHPIQYAVGENPGLLFVGKFESSSNLDLVTINSGSNDVTLISDFVSQSHVTHTYSTGGLHPDGAFAVDVNHNGVLDLMVANYGDGQLSLFQGAPLGMQLVSTISDPNLPHPTAAVFSDLAAGTLSFYASTAGVDSAMLLTLNTGGDTTPRLAANNAELSLPPELVTTSSSSSSDLNNLSVFIQFIPLSDTSLDLVALLLPARKDEELLPHDLALLQETILALSRAAVPLVQDIVRSENVREEPSEGGQAPDQPPGVRHDPSKPTPWIRFVLGVDEALEGERLALRHPTPARQGPTTRERWARADTGAVPGRGDREVPDVNVLLASLAYDSPRSDEATVRAVDEAIPMLWSDGSGASPMSSTGAPAPIGPAPPPDANVPEPRERATRSGLAVTSSVAVASHMLINTLFHDKRSGPRPASRRGRNPQVGRSRIT